MSTRPSCAACSYSHFWASPGGTTSGCPHCAEAGAGVVNLDEPWSTLTAGLDPVTKAPADLFDAGRQPDTAPPLHADLVITLPTYPWQRGHQGADGPDGPDSCGRVHSDGPVGHPLLGERAAVADPTWHGVLDLSRMPWIASSAIGADTTVPVSVFLEAALAAGAAAYDCAEVEVLDLNFVRALVFPAAVLPAAETRREVLFQVGLRPESGVVWMSSRSQATAQWQLNARGRVRRLHSTIPAALDLDAIRARTTADASSGEVLAAYHVAELTEEYFAHPVLIEVAFQCVAPVLAETFGRRAFSPTAVERAQLWRRPEKSGFIHARARLLDARETVWDLTVTDETGAVYLELAGCRLRRSDSEPEAPDPAHHYATELRAAPHPDVPVEPVRLPAPAALLAATAQRRQDFAIRHDNRYDEFAPLVKLCTAHFAAAAFADMLAGQREFGLDALRNAGVRPEFDDFVSFLIRSACRHGLLEQANSVEADTRPAPQRWHFAKRPQPHEIFRHLLRRFPDWSALMTVTGRHWLHLSEILRGELVPHLAASVYEDSPALQAHYYAASEILTEVVRHWPLDRSLRVLEIGTSAGGVTAALLPVLPPERTRYVFADTTEQNFGPAEFDLVIVDHALHQAADPRVAVDRASELLADGGLLLAVAHTDPDFATSLVGMLDNASESSTLTCEDWLALLETSGYPEVVLTGLEQHGSTDASAIVARRADRAQANAAPSCMPTHEHWIISAEDSEIDLAHALSAILIDVSAPSVTILEPGSEQASWSDALPPSDGAAVHVVQLFGESSTVDLTMRRLADVQTAARALAELPPDTSTRLSLVTRPTGLFPAPETAHEPFAAAVWGVGRALAVKYPHVGCRRISLEPSADPTATARRLARDLVEPSGDDEVVLTKADRFIPTRRDCSPPPPSPVSSPGAAFRLELRDPGPAHRLTWVPDRPPIPGPGEVLIKVRAAALNHRDVVLANGLLPADAETRARRAPAHDAHVSPQIGLECAGDVVAAGPGLAEFAPGDRVFALGTRCMASHVLARVGQVGRMPNRMRYTEAATLPVVFLTNQQSLEHLARLAPHETVLVHGAAGGVGLAAIQYAHSLGARVIATAGTPVKRDLLRLLGVRDVFDSRSHAFADQVLTATDGDGVDVVLNSLTGDAIARSLECLRPGGRFVELGRHDVGVGIDADQSLLLRSFRNNISFFGVDLAQLALQRPDQARAQFAQLARRVADGVYHPLPHQIYPAARIGDALKALEGSLHVGKVVVEFGEPVPIERPVRRVRLSREATYLVTGRLDGLGAATARYLADRGARHLTLLCRQGIESPGASALVEELAVRAVKVRVHAGDTGDVETLTHIAAEADAAGHPLAGVAYSATHSALASDLRNMIALDAVTRDRSVDLFVAYSSEITPIGSHPNQASHAVADCVLEAMTRARRWTKCMVGPAST